MRWKVVLASLSRLLIVVGLSMIIPLICAIYFDDGSWLAIVYSMVITIGIGIIIYILFPLENTHLRHIEGYLIVTCAWLTVVLFGTLPYLFSGTMNFTDALFETMSGFTTTGASILKDVEAMPEGILMWRSLTQWLGGMGIIVLFVALVARFGPGANKIFNAEAPGPVLEKLTPRISDTAKNLWKFYMIFTLIQIILLAIAGMTFYDAMAHTFATIATGGFSTKNAGVGYYMDNAFIQLIIILFMFLGGTNFALYYLVWKNKTLKVFLDNEEFMLYLKIAIIAAVLVSISLYLNMPEGQGIIPITALFQVVSILTTTGFATVDYDMWPNLARNVMFILLFIGGSLGSTAGGIKIGRFLILIKYTLSELVRSIHPRLVRSLKVNRVLVDDKIVINTFIFFFAYISIVGVSTIVMSTFGLDLESALTSVLACIGVIGPGLGIVGPVMNYADIPVLGKYFLAFLMLVGRLEIFTVFVLFYPKNWT
ncbi:MAG: TrkH family potassium uptake protein [Clostridia bacterium]|nr:TrkH family potassium uptake protein [Clostridia bacterium]